jgi:hypothetical protein
VDRNGTGFFDAVCLPGYIGRHQRRSLATPPLDQTETCLLMPTETMEFLLLLGGWVVAFLLGRELQAGFRLWRLRVAEQRIRRPD